MKKLLRFILLISLLIIEPGHVDAQIIFPPDPCGPPDVPCPVDGGLALLIGTGILIGIRQAKLLKG